MDNCPKCKAEIARVDDSFCPARITYKCGSMSYENKPGILVLESKVCLRRQLTQRPVKMETVTEVRFELANIAFRKLLDRYVAQSNACSDAEAEVRLLRERLVMRATACSNAEAEVERLEQTIKELQFAYSNSFAVSRHLHPRIIKLARSGKRFIVIGSHEPYFNKAYQMIREQELKQGTWLFPDDQEFVDAHKEWIEIQNA